jgi:hypothetical protein
MIENPKKDLVKEKKKVLGDLPETILQNLYKNTVQNFDLSKEKDLVSLVVLTHARHLKGTSFEKNNSHTHVIRPIEVDAEASYSLHLLFDMQKTLNMTKEIWK